MTRTPGGTSAPASGSWRIAACRPSIRSPSRSADREWIDLHWGFQIPLALAYRLGGVAGMILLASAVCGVTLLIAMTARMRDWPAWVVAAAWVPALLVMSTRLPPRPEIFSLAFLAAYMAVLLRCDRRPALAWALPAIQVLWVNSHGLFILGPIILGAYLADGALRTLRGRRAAGEPADRTGRSLVDARRARLGRGRRRLPGQPLRVAQRAVPPGAFREDRPSGGDLQGEHRRVQLPFQVPPGRVGPIAMRSLFGRGEFFLLLMLPTSFLVPAIWAIWTEAAPRDGSTRPSFASRWLLGMAIAAGLTIFATFSLPLASTPAWRIQAGRWAPAGFLALGFVAAAVVVWRSPLAALLSACGGVALAGGLPWLAAGLLGHDAGRRRPVRHRADRLALGRGAGRGRVPLPDAPRRRKAVPHPPGGRLRISGPPGDAQREHLRRHGRIRARVRAGRMGGEGHRREKRSGGSATGMVGPGDPGRDGRPHRDGDRRRGNRPIAHDEWVALGARIERDAVDLRARGGPIRRPAGHADALPGL